MHSLMRSSKAAILYLAFLALIAAGTAAGCHRDSEPHTQSRIPVVTVGDTTLWLETVLQDIPRGLPKQDSLEMFRGIVETWLRRQVVLDIAAKNIGDMDQIDRMVENYRADLIMNRYLSLIDDGASKTVDRKAIERYYRQHGDSMLTEEPLVKGIFLKTHASDIALPQMRASMKKPDSKAIENLERNGLRQAVQYEYFMEQWLPWHEVADLVPYRFFDADAFLESTRDFETEYGGSVYLIHISEYLPTGSKMPEEYARGRIRQQMLLTTVVKNRENVMTGIYRKAMEEGRLEAGIYDPATGKLKSAEDLRQN